MSGVEEFKDFFAKMDEVEEKERQKQQERLDRIIAETLKGLGCQQEEDPVMKTINDVLKRVDSLLGKRMSLYITPKEFEALGNACPEFAEATKVGFSEEEVKRYIVVVFDQVFNALNIGKLEHTLSNGMIAAIRGKKIDFSQFSGIGAYNYMRNNGSIFSQYLEPEFKKKIIYCRAIEIVVKTKTISFNTAVKRAIHEIENNEYTPKMDADDQEFLDDISGIINPLIDLYIENEVEIISAIARKIK